MRYFERWALAHDINKLPAGEREEVAKESITRWNLHPEMLDVCRLAILVLNPRESWSAEEADRLYQMARAVIAKVDNHEPDPAEELTTTLETLGEWARQVSDRKDVPQAIRTLASAATGRPTPPSPRPREEERRHARG